MMLPDPDTLHIVGKVIDHGLAAYVVWMHRHSLAPALKRLTERVGALEIWVFGHSKDAAAAAAPEVKP